MTRRVWILLLGAGLCGSLPACQTLGDRSSVGKVALERDQIVNTPAESPLLHPLAPGEKKQASDEPPSPYAAIPHKEPEKSTKANNGKTPEILQTSADSPLSPSSPYAVVASSPGSTTSAKDSSREAKLASVMSMVKKSSPAAPEPPPPEPPNWDVPSPTPYAANPKPVPVASKSSVGSKTSEVSMSSDVSATSSPSPYAALANQKLLANQKQIPISDSGTASSYPVVSGQVPKATAVKPPAWNSETISPYAEVRNFSPTMSSVKSDATQPIASGSPETQPPAPATNPEIATSAKEITSPSIQQMNHSQEPAFSEIKEAPAASPPEVGLDWTNDSAAGALLITRKSDESPLIMALKSFAAKRPLEALNWLKNYDEPNQEILQRMLPLLDGITQRDLTRSDVEKGIGILEEFYNLIGIRPEGELAIEKLCLCNRVKTFGDYEPFPQDHKFQPRDLVWIYAEIRNFTCERRDSGNGEMVFETRLTTTARITDYANTREWQLRFDRRCGPDQSRSMRRDYWDNLSFNVPDLPPGGYTLWLKVVDEPTGRFKERPVDFQVVPQRGS
jgi:hypothetical protein